MSDITQVVPVPTPVTLAGRHFLASELRVRDLALLTAYVKRRLPSPYDVAEPMLIAQTSGRAWKQLLGDTLAAQEQWPPELVSPEADAILGDDEGWAYFTWIVLRREHTALSVGDVRALLAGVSLAEVRKLSRVAWAIDPLTIIAAMVDGPRKGDGEANSRDWAAARYRYETECKVGPMFDDLTLTQLASFMCGGELPEAGHETGPADQFDWSVVERRKAFWAELDEPSDGEGG